MSIFTHTPVPVSNDCKCLISPSLLSRFYSDPSDWYKSHVLNLEPSFKGNLSSLLGQICHHIYECVSKNIEVTRTEINQELEAYVQENSEIFDPSIISEIEEDYPEVASVVVNEFLLRRNRHTNFKVEDTVSVKISDGIYLGGTCDRVEFDGKVCEIIDHKTVGKKPNETVIPLNYKLQLLAYAYIYRSQGYNPTDMTIVYGVRPQKTIKARCIVVHESITPECWKLIEDTLALISDTVHLVLDKPELNYLLFKDYTLKELVNG